MEELFFSELSVIEDTNELLKELGDAKVVYATAEFSPFSSQRKPDLQFNPSGIEDTMFFIEYKFKSVNGFDKYYFKNILEHREFIQEDTDIQIKYAFATPANISEEAVQFLANNDIAAFSSVTNAQELYNYIKKWFESTIN